MKPKHPELQKVQGIWTQIKILKEECREEYGAFMLPLPHEKKNAQADRMPSFIRGFVNPSQMLLHAKGDAIFRREVRRQNLSAGQEAFVKAADRSGQSLQEMMQNEVAPSLAAYGTVFAVMDKPKVDVTSKAQELDVARPYLTILSPFQVFNFAWAPDGALLWFQYVVDAPYDMTDPFNPKRQDGWKADKGLATWTRETYSVRSLTNSKQFFVAETPHDFGFVPVIIQAVYVEPNKTVGASTFFASSDYIIMGNNLECASNQEVFKNADATLTLDVQDWDDEQQPVMERNPDTNLRQLSKEAHDQANVLTYTKNKPEYLTRDLSLIDKAETRADKYFERAVENEKRALSVQALKTPESGVAKAYNFQDVNGVFATFAAALEHFERQAVSMAGQELDDDADFVLDYARDFDIRSFTERLEFVKGVIDSGIQSPLAKKEVYKSLVPEITSDAAKQAAINAEIDAAADPKPPVTPPNPNPPPPPADTRKVA